DLHHGKTGSTRRRFPRSAAQPKTVPDRLRAESYASRAAHKDRSLHLLLRSVLTFLRSPGLLRARIIAREYFRRRGSKRDRPIRACCPQPDGPIPAVAHNWHLDVHALRFHQRSFVPSPRESAPHSMGKRPSRPRGLHRRTRDQIPSATLSCVNNGAVETW